MTYDCVVVGAGPAGLASATYCCRGGLKTLVLEKKTLGGQISSLHRIENYPGYEETDGYTLSMRMTAQAKKFGAEIEYDDVRKIHKNDRFIVETASERKIGCKGVIVACGAEHKTLNVDGEKEFFGRGVSYCATCDGHFFKGKKCAVVGGGRSAITEALYLADILSEVYVIHRRDELRAEKYLQNLAFEKDNIKFVWNAHVMRIGGKETVEFIEYMDKKKNEIKKLSVSGVFIYIGMKSNTDFVDVKKDDRGFIMTDEYMATSVDGIYAAGDCRSKRVRQIATAVGDGVVAAESLIEYLK